MGFSPLAQALTVAVLAYASGLLLGLSFHRGEIGRLKPRAALPPAEHVPAGRPARRGRLLRTLRHSLPEISLSVRRWVMLALLIAILMAMALGFIGLLLDIQASPQVRRVTP